MLILPAIDLLDGSCVRLARGSFDRVTVYADDPAARAAEFAEQGARALHVVDLEGARSGGPVHLDVVRDIRAGFPGFLQVGGGLRTTGDIAACLDLGVDRLILGTAAVGRPGWLTEAIGRHGADRLAVAVDLRGRRVMVDGWRRRSDSDLSDVLARLEAAGVRTVVFTDTERDGMLGSADAARARDFVRAGFETVVAGGVTTADDIRRLAAAGAAGAIIGSALYEGRLTVEEALAAAANAARSTEPRC